MPNTMTSHFAVLALAAVALIAMPPAQAFGTILPNDAPLSAPSPPIVQVKGGGGLKGPFNTAAKGPKTTTKWTLKPVYPLYKGNNPPAGPAPVLKPKGMPNAKPLYPRSRLPQHFNYHAQRPLKFDFKNAAKR